VSSFASSQVNCNENEVLTTAFRDSAMEEHRISNGTQNRGISVEECEHSGHLSTSCMDENKKVCVVVSEDL
jgi:hypothetical protein